MPVQQALAKTFRSQALAYRAQAGDLRHQAAQSRTDADKLADEAKQLRLKATDSKAKGNQAEADSLDQQAKERENGAASERDAAETFDERAGKLEQLAAEKEADARKLEAQSNADADRVYRKLRQSLAKASGDLLNLKQHQTATRVGRQSMSVRYLFSHVHDEELKSFGQADLDALFRGYEQALGQMSAKTEQDRDLFAAGRLTAEDYIKGGYGLFEDVVKTMEDAEFTLVTKGYDTYEADFYKVERQLNAEYSNTDTALSNNPNITYDQKRAILDALRQRQSLDRRAVFFDVVKRYRSEKNRLAFFWKDWIDEVTGWHDFAAKLSKGDDPHRVAAADFDNLLRGYFTKDSANLPQSLAIFAFEPGSPDRFSTPYGDDDPWCKALPFPDVQDHGSPGLLRMQSIIDNLSTLVRSGKLDGAARTIGP